jgi:molybdopterin molybdotransferase
MIAVEEALRLIQEEQNVITETETIATQEALGRVLSKSIQAPIALPSFRQSAMDGYALHIGTGLTYTVVGEQKAGDAKTFDLKAGECVRIFTGAAVPDTANAVVIQEKVQRFETKIELENLPQLGQNIRAHGTQIKKGSFPLEKGQVLNPAGLGLIQSLGIQKVKVFRKPRVCVIVTGNELLPPGSTLSEGKIFESNSLILKAALHQIQIEPQIITGVPDQLEDTEDVLKGAFATSDLVLISGGISVGDYDFVGKALQNLGVKDIFYKVRQRPGKPLYFGKKGNTFCFALPGNPASTLTCFYVYVLPLLNYLRNFGSLGLRREKLPLTQDFQSSEARALFLKATVNQGKVSLLDHQNSSMLISFAKANAVVFLPENGADLKKHEKVEVLFLPDFNESP